MACDGVPAASGGQIYIAEYRAVSGPPDCFRDAKEALVARRKGTGAETVLVDRIDAAEGLAPCDDYDPADDLQVTRDGAAVFVALPGGIYRIRPTTLLMTPDIDDVFQVHPDGSVLVVTATDQGPTGLLRLYKVSPGVAINGAPHLDELTPCATIEVPNNRGPGRAIAAHNLRLLRSRRRHAGLARRDRARELLRQRRISSGVKAFVSPNLRVQAPGRSRRPPASTPARSSVS